MTLTDFLIWLVGGGSIIAVSWAFERMNWYQVLSSNAKQWVFFGACAVVSLSSYYVQTYVPVANLQALAPVFQILAGLFIALFLVIIFPRLEFHISSFGKIVPHRIVVPRHFHLCVLCLLMLSLPNQFESCMS